MKNFLLYLAVILANSTILYPVSAQEYLPANHIEIEATATVHVSADLVKFRVTITQFSKNAKEAFQLHKEQEAFLTELLLEEQITDSNITANPISISNARNPAREEGFETRQTVYIQLDDVNQFESMQLTLIENEFTNFSGSFASTEGAGAADEALKKAMEKVGYKAELIAESIEKEIYSIYKVVTGREGNVSPRRSESLVAYDISAGSLLQFERSIPVQQSVIVYYLFD